MKQNAASIDDAARAASAAGEGARRAAGLLFVVTGLLYVGSLLVRGAPPDPKADPRQFAEVVSDPFVVAAGFSYLLAIALHALGLVALFVAVRRHGERLARAGLAFSLLGFILCAAVVGVLVFAAPALGRAYLAGRADALDVFDVMAGPFIGSLLLQGVLVVAGAVLLAYWGSRCGGVAGRPYRARRWARSSTRCLGRCSTAVLALRHSCVLLCMRTDGRSRPRRSLVREIA